MLVRTKGAGSASLSVNQAKLAAGTRRRLASLRWTGSVLTPPEQTQHAEAASEKRKSGRKWNGRRSDEIRYSRNVSVGPGDLDRWHWITEIRSVHVDKKEATIARKRASPRKGNRVPVVGAGGTTCN
jgi:hypothetical protein